MVIPVSVPLLIKLDCEHYHCTSLYPVLCKSEG